MLGWRFTLQLRNLRDYAICYTYTHSHATRGKRGPKFKKICMICGQALILQIQTNDDKYGYRTIKRAIVCDKKKNQKLN